MEERSEKCMRRENEHEKKQNGYCEQDMVDQIARLSENTEVPDSLRPENIERLLKGKKQKKHFHSYGIGLAAACVAVITGIIVWQYGSLHHEMTDSKRMSAGNTERKIIGSRKIRIAESYDEIYKYIKRSQGNEGIAMYVRSGNETSAAADTGSGNETSAAAMDADGRYSQTNVRQSGVDEGDIAKTDGTYLYVREDNGRTIDIIDAGKGQLEKYNEITLEKEYTIQEFYIDTDRKKLVAVCQKECTDADNKKQVGTAVRQQTKTAAVTYDISDIKKPVKEGEVTQSGTYNSSRMADGYLYLFSEYYTGSNVVKDKPVTYVPMVNDKAMSQSSICLPPENCGMMYEVISSVDISKPDETADHKAILSEGGQMYVSKKNIYYYEEEWTGNGKQEKTLLRKLSYKKGKLAVVAQKTFRGYLNDSFSIDEYDGYLRMVVTRGKTNAVYVLDQKLKLTGKITNLAKDERVYSARFLGNTGYFVTYKETDPLFSVDLSNPKNPKILGRLKIPGFSNYLHFYGEDKLLGIGMDVDKKGDVTDGVKLSMFDISDKKNV